MLALRAGKQTLKTSSPVGPKPMANSDKLPCGVVGGEVGGVRETLTVTVVVDYHTKPVELPKLLAQIEAILSAGAT